MSAGVLQLPGVALHHEVRGEGPVVLLIAGGAGDAGAYAPIAAPLGRRYTVVSYDRRGYSRSVTDRPAPDSGWLAQDVTDALALLDRYSPEAPALVFGSSSGAIVGLHLLAAHGDRVRNLIAHEPPLLGLLPDAADHRAFLDAVFDTMLRDGVDAAMRRFEEHLGSHRNQPPPQAQLSPQARDLLARLDGNREHWLRHELRQYPRAVPDLDQLWRYREKLVPAAGADSRELLLYRPAAALAERLGRPLLELPGDHVGYVTEPAAFAAALDAALGAAVTA